jgi:hypothetical protein
MRHIQKLRSNRMGQAGVAVGVLLLAWVAAGAPAYCY